MKPSRRLLNTVLQVCKSLSCKMTLHLNPYIPALPESVQASLTDASAAACVEASLWPSFQDTIDGIPYEDGAEACGCTTSAVEAIRGWSRRGFEGT